MRFILLFCLGFGLMSFNHLDTEVNTPDPDPEAEQMDLWTEYTGEIQIRSTEDYDLVLYLRDKTHNGLAHFVYVQADRPVIENQIKDRATLTVHPDKGYYDMEVDGDHFKFAMDDNIYGLSDFTLNIDDHSSLFTSNGDLKRKPDVKRSVPCLCQDKTRADDDCLSGGEGSLSCNHKWMEAGSLIYCRVLRCGNDRYSCCTPE